MKLDKEITDAVRAACADPANNPHNLKRHTVYERIRKRGWTLEQALNTPVMTRSQAGQIAAKNPYWRNFTIKEYKDE